MTTFQKFLRDLAIGTLVTTLVLAPAVVFLLWTTSHAWQSTLVESSEGAVVAATPIPYAPISCKTSNRVVAIKFSKRKYPTIYRHWRITLEEGYPKVYVLNRDGADRRRDRLMSTAPKQPKGDGMDLDEQPPAVGRRTWKAHLMRVPEGENRSNGAVLGNRLRKWCDGVRFRYAWW